MSIESREEAVNVLWGAAAHYESEHVWLYGEFRKFIRAAMGDAGEEAAEDMAMAQEALESLCWWLRKCASDIEGVHVQTSREDGV